MGFSAVRTIFATIVCAALLVRCEAAAAGRGFLPQPGAKGRVAVQGRTAPRRRPTSALAAAAAGDFLTTSPLPARRAAHRTVKTGGTAWLSTFRALFAESSSMISSIAALPQRLHVGQQFAASALMGASAHFHTEF